MRSLISNKNVSTAIYIGELLCLQYHSLDEIKNHTKSAELCISRFSAIAIELIKQYGEETVLKSIILHNNKITVENFTEIVKKYYNNMLNYTDYIIRNKLLFKEKMLSINSNLNVSFKNTTLPKVAW